MKRWLLLCLAVWAGAVAADERLSVCYNYGCAAEAEVRKSATGCRFYAEHAEAFLAPEPVDPAAVGADKAYAVYQPLGVVLAVMPWNFPVWQVLRFAAPALMAGNVGLLKHASNVPQTAEYLGTLFDRAGFPAGSFANLRIGSAAVEKVLQGATTLREINKVTFVE